jgi:hypothetical protein
MDPKAKELLDVFINHAHKSMPRSMEMHRFLDFVIAVHRENLAASTDEVLDLTTRADFPEFIAVRLSMVFSYGVELLKRYDAVKK